jgi:hypothetical protein
MIPRSGSQSGGRFFGYDLADSPPSTEIRKCEKSDDIIAGGSIGLTG